MSTVRSLALPHALPAPKRDARLPRPQPVRMRPPQAADTVGVKQRRIVTVAVLALHVFGVWGALQVPAVRQAVVEAAPIFVDLLAPPAPPTPLPPVPVTPPPVLKAPPLVVATPKSQQPPPQFTAEPEPVPDVSPMAAVAPVEAAPPQPASAPKIIPASAVQYLDAPPPEYPRLSKRDRESGRSLLRVLIDERGLPAQVQVHRSSGHARLDDAALAAVKKWRFKPYAENGVATAGWAFVPLDFELER